MKLHLGCGKRYLEGFIHIDIADFEHIDYKSSINDLNMINDESCDLIYASHVLEYFNKKELTDFMDSLNTKQFAEMQKFFDTMPKLSHDIEFINPKTKKKHKKTLEGLNSFFA